MGLFTEWRNKEELTSARMNRMLDEIENKLNELNQNIANLSNQLIKKVDAPFINGWMNETYLEPVRLWKIGNTVFISGIAKGGTRTRGTGMFYLPEGYRPLKSTGVGVSSLFSNSVYRIDFGSDGNVIIQSDNFPDYISFAGIHWRTD